MSSSSSADGENARASFSVRIIRLDRVEYADDDEGVGGVDEVELEDGMLWVYVKDDLEDDLERP